MKDLWDKRYNTQQFVYGSSPNSFLKSELGNSTGGPPSLEMLFDEGPFHQGEAEVIRLVGRKKQ